jgi:hypothetical protein
MIVGKYHASYPIPLFIAWVRIRIREVPWDTPIAGIKIPVRSISGVI